MRENVTQGACPLAPALTTGALNHPASFLPSFPLQQLAELGEEGRLRVGEPLPPPGSQISSSLKVQGLHVSPTLGFSLPLTRALFSALLSPSKPAKFPGAF